MYLIEKVKLKNKILYHIVLNNSILFNILYRINNMFKSLLLKTIKRSNRKLFEALAEDEWWDTSNSDVNYFGLKKGDYAYDCTGPYPDGSYRLKKYSRIEFSDKPLVSYIAKNQEELDKAINTLISKGWEKDEEVETPDELSKQHIDGWVDPYIDSNR